MCLKCPCSHLGLVHNIISYSLFCFLPSEKCPSSLGTYWLSSSFTQYLPARQLWIGSIAISLLAGAAAQTALSVIASLLACPHYSWWMIAIVLHAGHCAVVWPGSWGHCTQGDLKVEEMHDTLMTRCMCLGGSQLMLYDSSTCGSKSHCCQGNGFKGHVFFFFPNCGAIASGKKAFSKTFQSKTVSAFCINHMVSF